MRIRYRAFFIGKSPAPVNTRTIVFDVAGHGLPACAWCTMKCLQPVAEVVQQGIENDFITRICFCPNCKMGTAIEFEQRHEPE